MRSSRSDLATLGRRAALMPRPARSIALAAAMSLFAGCTASGGGRGTACMPSRGMGTADLAACGCRRYDGGNMRSLPASRAAGGAGAETVIIVNYICPLGDAGIAWATVINGTVDRVDY